MNPPAKVCGPGGIGIRQACKKEPYPVSPFGLGYGSEMQG